MTGTTYTWFGGSGQGTIAADWSPAGPPGPGSTAIINAGTVQLTDAQLNSNTLLLNAGTLQISNDVGSLTSNGTTVSGFDSTTTLIAGNSGAAEVDLFGDFLNDGTIDAAGNTVTLSLQAYTGSSSYVGTLANNGLIEVTNGATLHVTGTSAATFQGNNVLVNDGSLLIDMVNDVSSTFTLQNNGTLELNDVTNASSVVFDGTSDLLKLDASAIPSVGTGAVSVVGYTNGDTIDIGTQAVGTIIYNYATSFGSGGPTLTVEGTAGNVLFSGAFTNANGGQVFGNTGTFNATTLASGTVAAGPFEIVKSGSDYLLEVLPPSTWKWVGPTTGGSEQNASNWSLTSGPGNANGIPASGDSAIINSASIGLGTDINLSGVTLYLGGAAGLGFIGDSGISVSNPTFDSNTVVTTAESGATVAANATLNFSGIIANDGSIIADGTVGSSMTVNVTQDGTIPGYFINENVIEAEASNSLTISIQGTSELFNAGLIEALGGDVLVNTSGTGQIAGGIAGELGGVWLIGGGGTIEINAGFTSGAAGSAPTYVFADGTSGDTLKIDQLKQFSGRILGFATGDTIDLGGSLAIGTIVVKSDGRVLLENSAGTTLATLTMASGQENVGTFAVSGGIADGFTLTTPAGQDTLLTTSVVNSFYNNTSGSWQTGSLWSTGTQPGTLSTAVIGDGASSGFVLTTGAAPVQASSLSEVSGNATLQITSATTIGNFGTASAIDTNYGIQQISGDIEVTSGETLTTTQLKQFQTGATLTVDTGGVLDLVGHDNIGLVNNGTISQNTIVNGTTFANGNSAAAFINGTAVVNGGTVDAIGVVNSGTTYVGGFIAIAQGSDGTPATMTVEAGGTVGDTYSYLGSDPTSYGSLTLTGAGTTWDDANDPTDTLNTRGYMLVGNDTQSGTQPSPAPAGTASLTVENGATLNEATYARIGNSADSAGSATITATGSSFSGGVWNIGTSSTGGFLTVGNSGSGTLTVNNNGTVNILGGSGTFVSNGTNFTGQGLGIASAGAASGTVVVSGGGVINVASQGTTGGVVVGKAGQGLLEINAGGTVAVTGGGMNVGQSLGAVGTLIVAGGVVTLGSGLTIGNGGTGTLDLNAGSISVGAALQVGDGQFVSTSSSVTANGTVTTTVTTTVASGIGTGTITAGTLSATGGLNVGLGATGSLGINGGKVTVAGGIVVGNMEVATTTQTSTVNGTVVSTSTLSSTPVTGTGTLVVGGGTLISTGGGLSAGNAGVGTVQVTAGGSISIANGFLTAGNASGSTGNVQVSGSNAVITAEGFNIGNAGTGTLTVGVGGQVIANGGTTQGSEIGGSPTSGASGTVIVNGGTISQSGNFFDIGGTNTSGSLLIENSGQLTTSETSVFNGNTFFSSGQIGASGTGTAFVSITSNGTWTANGGLSIGQGNTGAVDINTGGLLNAGTNSVTVGSGTNGVGTVSVESGGTLLAGELQIGDAFSGSAFGTLTVGSNGHVIITAGTTGGLQVGNFTGSSGNLTINGGTVSEIGTGNFNLGGSNASGTLLIESAGQFTTGNTNVVNGSTSVSAGQIGASGTGTAVVTVSGGTWTADGGLTIGNNGTGSVTINSNGVLNAGINTVTVGNNTGDSGTISVSGGGSLNAGGFTFGSSGTGVLTVGTGGTVTDSGSTALELGFNNGGSGTITVNGGLLNAETNGFVIAGGSSSSGTVTVSNSGSLSANQFTIGQFGTGALTVQSGGVVTQSGGNTFALGQGSSGAGAVTINGGTINIGSATAVLGNAANSTGSLSVTNGAFVGGTLDVGGGGTGALSIGVGGTVNAAAVAIGGGDTVTLSGGILDPLAAITINGSGLIQGSGTIEGTVSLGASASEVTASGGALVITGAVSGNGTLDIASGSTLQVDGTVSSAAEVVFGSGPPGTLEIGPGALSGFGGVISSFGVSDELILSGTSIASVNFGGNLLTLFANGGTELGTVAFAPGAVTGGYLAVDGSGGVTSVACFLAGTRIDTDRGDIPVEHLREGDLVRTVLDGRAAPVVWVGHRTVDCARHPKPELVWPVRISAHAFGAQTPRRDLWLSPDHAVYVNEVLVPVKHLVNGSTITQIQVDRVTYYHLELPKHDVVLAEGLPSESYLDTRDRMNFANGGAVVRAYPDFSARAWEALGCAPLVVTGPLLAAAQAMVADRLAAA